MFIELQTGMDYISVHQMVNLVSDADLAKQFSKENNVRGR